MLSLKSLSQNIAFTLKLPSDTYLLFRVDVQYYLYHIFLQNVVTKTLMYLSKFVEINCMEYDLTLQTVNTELEITVSSFCKIVSNICIHHVYSVNTSRTTWKRSHVYRVNRGCPRGHLLVTIGRKTPCCGTH